MDFPLGVIADDLTGACDTGVQFTCSRRMTTVYLDELEARNYSDVIVTSTSSRHMSPGAAEDISFRFSHKLLEAGAVQIYKKIDSVMRGNVGAELEGVMRACGCNLALVCPAYPQMGRTLINGVLHINECSLDNSETKQDLLNGPESADAIKIISAQCARPIVSVPLQQVREGVQHLKALFRELVHQGKQVLVVDAQTQADLETLKCAASLDIPHVLAGSGGLASAMREEKPHFVSPSIRMNRGILMICGSHVGIAHRQIKMAREKDMLKEFEIDPEALLDGDVEMLGVVKSLMRGQTVAISVGRKLLPGDVNCNGQRIQEALGALVGGWLELYCPGALFVTGGDTALSICRRLDAWGIRLEGEIEPGVPYGHLQSGLFNGLPIVTKSGGFGDESIFCRILKNLQLTNCLVTKKSRRGYHVYTGTEENFSRRGGSDYHSFPR